MPEPRKPDDLVIDDEATRELLQALLGKWGDEAIQPLVRRVEVELLRLDSFADMRFALTYTRESYNADAGHKPAEVLSERREARSLRLEKALAIFQSSFGEAVKRSLLLTIEELAKGASNAATQEAEEKLKAAKMQHARNFGREFNEFFGIDQPPLGRREKYPRADVERRSVAIIRAIGAGERERGKVALVFYSDVNPADAEAAQKLAQAYKTLAESEKRRKRDKYSDLLSAKRLTYEGLLKKAKRIGGKKGR